MPEGDLQNPVVGPRVVADNQYPQLRAERTAALVVGHAHGEMYEEVSRGNVWTISTAAAGIAIATSVGIPATAANNPIVGIYNPPGSVNMHVTRTILVATTGTAVTGGFAWYLSANPTGITSSGVQARNNKTFVKGGHYGIAFDGSTPVTGQTVAPTLFRQFGGGFPGALAAGTNSTLEETEEDIVLGPNNYLGLYAVLGATGLNVVGSLTWAEVPTGG